MGQFEINHRWRGAAAGVTETLWSLADTLRMRRSGKSELQISDEELPLDALVPEPSPDFDI
jgi:hypothetical protein